MPNFADDQRRAIKEIEFFGGDPYGSYARAALIQNMDPNEFVKLKMDLGDWGDVHAQQFMDAYQRLWSDPEERRKLMAEGAQTARQEAAQQALPEMADSQFGNAIARNVVSGATQGLGSLISMGSRPFNSQAADEWNQAANLIDQASQLADEKSALPPWLNNMVRGAANSLSQMGAMMPLGGAGMIGGFALAEGNQAITRAKEAGLSPAETAKYAAAATIIEGSIAGIFQVTGLGGLEKVLSGGGKVTKSGVKALLKATGISLAEELPEEVLTELTHNLNTAVHLDPSATSAENMAQTVAQTIGQTILSVGLAQGIQGAFAQGAMRRQRQKIDEIAGKLELDPEQVRAAWEMADQHAKTAEQWQQIFDRETQRRKWKQGQPKADAELNARIQAEEEQQRQERARQGGKRAYSKSAQDAWQAREQSAKEVDDFLTGLSDEEFANAFHWGAVRSVEDMTDRERDIYEAMQDARRRGQTDSLRGRFTAYRKANRGWKPDAGFWAGRAQNRAADGGPINVDVDPAIAGEQPAAVPATRKVGVEATKDQAQEEIQTFMRDVLRRPQQHGIQSPDDIDGFMAANSRLPKEFATILRAQFPSQAMSPEQRAAEVERTKGKVVRTSNGRMGVTGITWDGRYELGSPKGETMTATASHVEKLGGIVDDTSDYKDGQSVLVLPPGARTGWIKGKVVRYVGSRSYEIEYGGRRGNKSEIKGRTYSAVVDEQAVKLTPQGEGAKRYREELESLPEEERAKARKDASAFDNLVRNSPALADLMAEQIVDRNRTGKEAGRKKQAALDEHNRLRDARRRAAKELGIEDEDINSPVVRAKHLAALQTWLDGPGKTAETAAIADRSKQDVERVSGDEKVYGAELRDGDQILHRGEWLIAEVDEAEGIVKLHDGTTIELDMADSLPARGGEIVGADGLSRTVGAEVDESFEVTGLGGSGPRPGSAPAVADLATAEQSGATPPQSRIGSPTKPNMPAAGEAVKGELVRSKGHAFFYTPEGQPEAVEVYREEDGSWYRAPVSNAMDVETNNRIGRWIGPKAWDETKVRQYLGLEQERATESPEPPVPVAVPAEKSAEPSVADLASVSDADFDRLFDAAVENQEKPAPTAKPLANDATSSPARDRAGVLASTAAIPSWARSQAKRVHDKLADGSLSEADGTKELAQIEAAVAKQTSRDVRETPKAQPDLFGQDRDLFTEARRPQPPPPPKERSAADILKEAAKQGVKGVDDAVKGLHDLFGGGARLFAGIPSLSWETYQKARPHFQRAYSEFVAAGRSLADFFQFMVSNFGAGIREYLRAFRDDLAGRLDRSIFQENGDVSGRPGDLEPGSGIAPDAIDVGQENARGNGPGEGGQSLGNVGPEPPAGEQPGSAGVPVGAAPADGAGRNHRSGGRGGRSRMARGAARGAESGGGRAPGDGGVSVDRDGAESVGAPAAADTGRPDAGVAADSGQGGSARLGREQRQRQQREAEKIPVVPGDLENVRQTLPMLFKEQQEDVWNAETRFADQQADTNRGVLFTNGTGTGKTFTGLGIVKRFLRQDAKHILIVTPSQKILNDWIKSAPALGFQIARLDDRKDNGDKAPVVATTYVNMQDNAALFARPWDLAIFDEAHHLSSSKEGTITKAGTQMRELLGANPSLARNRVAGDMQQAFVNALGTKPEEFSTWRIANMEENDPAAWRRLPQSLREEFARRVQEAQKAKVVFLSATPFAYHKSAFYGDGFLYTVNKPEEGRSRAYNEGSDEEQFLAQNFGYRMRYNKANTPGPEVDVGLMEREFNERLRREGRLVGRVLDIAQDYSRHFVDVDDPEIEPMNRFYRAATDWQESRDKWDHLREQMAKLWNYNRTVKILEAVKARAVLPRIQQHLDMGRKVVVFHSRLQEAELFPYAIPPKPDTVPEVNWRSELQAFYGAHPEFRGLGPIRFSDARTVLANEFGSLVSEFNGTISDKNRETVIADFNDDAGKARILLVQRDAGKEGMSVHDQTGKQPRVLIDLALPVRPTDFTQTEGRIYRTGQASDAIFEYPKTALGLEHYFFSSLINQRAGTAENLAMGNLARDLRSVIREGYLNSLADAPTEDQGKGGKDADRTILDTDDFQRAIALYHAQRKRSERRDQRLGKDYYATPEPLGYKMVEWGGARPAEDVLEPSAGHGAIARFFPETANRIFVERSPELSNLLRLNAGGKVRTMDFEDLPLQNKFDVIAMNPPFGHAGSMAIQHLAKAFRHLREGGRLIAILPEGSADAKFDAWYESDEAKQAYKVAEFGLPPVTFEKAGTNVRARVVVIDRHAENSNAPHGQGRIDIAGDNVAEFFQNLRELGVPDRAEAAPRDLDAMATQWLADRKVQVENKTTRFGKPYRMISAVDGMMVNEEGGNVPLALLPLDRMGGKWLGHAMPNPGWAFFADKASLTDIAQALGMEKANASGAESEPQYAIRTADVLQPRTLTHQQTAAALRKAFPKAAITVESQDGVPAFRVATPAGEFVVTLPDTIEIDPARFRATYGRRLRDSDVAAAAWFDQARVLQLARIADIGDIDHDSWHIAQTLADLSDNERQIVSNQFGSSEESQAEGYRKWAGETSTPWGKVFAKVRQFFRRLARALGLDLKPDWREVFDRVRSGDAFARAPRPVGQQDYHTVQYATGDKLAKVQIPVDYAETPLSEVSRVSNTEKIRQAASLLQSWPRTTTAADGSQILLHNPEGGSIGKRVLHLVWDKTANQVHVAKLQWLSRVPETLRTAYVRIEDTENRGNRVYLKKYPEGLHAVVVEPDGAVASQEPFSGGLITHLPKRMLGRHAQMTVEWQREDTGKGARQSLALAPPQPPASSAQGPLREAKSPQDAPPAGEKQTSGPRYSVPTAEDKGVARKLVDGTVDSIAKVVGHTPDEALRYQFRKWFFWGENVAGRQPELNRLDQQRKGAMEGDSRALHRTMGKVKQTLASLDQAISQGKVPAKFRDEQLRGMLYGTLEEEATRPENPVAAAAFDQVRALRQMIDARSHQMANQMGDVLPPGLAVAIDRNQGKYLIRAYRKFLDPSYHPSKQARANMEAAVADAILDKLESSAAKLNDAIARAYATAENRQALRDFLLLGDESLLAGRSDTFQRYARRFRRYYELLNEVYNNTVSVVQEGDGVGLRVPAGSLRSMAAGTAQYLALKDTQLTNVFGGKASPQWKTIRKSFMRRKDLAPVLRAFYGEITDLAAVAQMTLARQNQVLAADSFQREFVQWQEALPNDDPGRVLYRTPWISPDGRAFSYPLHDTSFGVIGKREMYTDRATFELLNQVDDLVASRLGRWYMKLMSVPRFTRTVMNPPTVMRNFLTNFLQAFADGEWFYRPSYWKGWTRTIQVLMGEPQEVDRLMRATLISASARGAELRANLREAFGDASTITPENVLGKLERLIAKGGNALAALYAGGDNIHKMVSYYAKVSRGMPEAEAIRRIRSAFPYYDEAPQAVTRVARRLPFTRDFVSFFVEVIRNSLNNYRNAYADLRKGDLHAAAGTLAMHGLVAAGIGGLSAAMVAAALSKITDKDYQALDPEEEWRVRRLLPDYQRTGNLLMVKDGDGQVQVTDLGYVVPYEVQSQMAEIIRQHHSGHGEDGAFFRFLKRTFGGLPMATSALVDLAANKDDQTGDPITLQTDTFWERSEKRLEYLARKLLIPSSGRYLKRAFDLATSETKQQELPSGEVITPGSEIKKAMTPLRVNTFNPETMFRARAWELFQSLRELQMQESVQRGRVERGTADYSQWESASNNAALKIDTVLSQQAAELIDAAAYWLPLGPAGLSAEHTTPGTIRRILLDVGFSRQDVEDMVRGGLAHREKLPK